MIVEATPAMWRLFIVPLTQVKYRLPVTNGSACPDIKRKNTAKIEALLKILAEREREELELIMLERWKAAREGRLR